MEMFKGNSEKVCDITHAGAVPARRLEAMDQSLEIPKKMDPTYQRCHQSWLAGKSAKSPN